MISENVPLILGTGSSLQKIKQHPYIGQPAINTHEQEIKFVQELNQNRENSRISFIEVDYYFEIQHEGAPQEAQKNAAKMVLEHGTLKPWHSEADASLQKPERYNEFMSWAVGVKLIGYNSIEKVEAGVVTIAYPLEFFDKTEETFPMAQLMMAIASEPFSAFSFYQGAKIMDVRFPKELIQKFPGIRWPHSRVLQYLNIRESDPIIGTIVKPKTGLTPELFSNCVVEAALAGARFTKADENMHLTLKEIPKFFGRTVSDLQKAGFDLGSIRDTPKGPRFLFAPHITAEPANMMDYARAAIEAGANALMFSPYYGGGFQKLAEISSKFDVPVYAHTAGMNVFTGSQNWGLDSSLMYRFAAWYGAAFMQLTAVNGYLKPDDTEKKYILEKLQRDALEGKNGMTLVIAGGLGPANIGENMKALGMNGRMFLAGTTVYSHPDGATSGVKALILAYRGYHEKGITDKPGLIEFGKSLGEEGKPLVKALE